MLYLLLYDYVDDMATRRDPHRPGHLALVRELYERGEIVAAGAFSGPLDGAAIVFRADVPAMVDDFIARDPYVQNGLVPSWRVRPWNLVVGAEALAEG